MVCGATEDGWLIELANAARRRPGGMRRRSPGPARATKSPPWKSSPHRRSKFPRWPKFIIRPWPRSCSGFRRADVAHPLDGFGMLIPEKEGFNILGALFSSSLFPNRAPEGEVTITCYIGGARAPLLPLQHARSIDGTGGQGPGNDFGRAGPADISARRRLSPGHSAIQRGLRKIPRA